MRRTPETKITHSQEIMHTLFRVRRSELAAIKYIIEAYEVIGPVSTMDRKAAIIRVSSSPSFVSLIHQIMNDLKKTYQIEEFS